MECRNVQEVAVNHGHGNKKRRESPTEYQRRRHEITALEMGELKVENECLRIMVEQLASSVEEVTLLKCIVEEQKEELGSTKLRILELEADLFFMSGDLHEKTLSEKNVKEKLDELSTRLKKAHDTEQNRKAASKRQVLNAFKWEERSVKPVVLRAVCGFWEASSGPLLEVEDFVNQKERMSQRERMVLWKEITLNGWSGKLRIELEKEFVKAKKYCPIRITRASDIDSRFNISAASEIAHCDPLRKRYERGLIPSDQTCRRVMQCVYNAAVQIGFSMFPDAENGNVWCWGDRDGRFINGVNRYVYEVYYKLDPQQQLAPAEDPWLIPLTGDLARVSFRGKQVTMCGVKQGDRRLPSQTETGKTMNQSRHMYTPALAGYKDEKSIMPYFEEFVQQFVDIEARGYCVVDGKEFKVNIHPFIVADMAFEHKYLKRGGGSAKTTHFCMFCSCTSHERHKGYAGGCLKCRSLSVVYDEETGVQQCLHHDVCTPAFLKWEEKRFEELTRRVASNIPMSKLPPWESVSALRGECWMRCTTAEDRSMLKKCTTEAQMEKWLLTKTRQGCTLTANEAHGIRYCAMEMVLQDLVERNIPTFGMSDGDKRKTLELVLREEEEWQRMAVYRRDLRFSREVKPDKFTLRVDRTVLDMLHCPMRMHEKVLNLLYAEILNGKTKNETNGSVKGKKRKKEVVGAAAVGQEVAKMSVSSHALPYIRRGAVVHYHDDGGKRERYGVEYEHGELEEMDLCEFREAHKLALLLQTDKDKEDMRADTMLKKKMGPALEQLTEVIRDLGSLGPTWTHQWDDNNKKALQQIKLPFDQSKRIFHIANIGMLQEAVEIAVPSEKASERDNWKLFLEHYVHAIAQLTSSVEYTPADIDDLGDRLDKCYKYVLKVAGIRAVTNYFHYLGSGHLLWLTKRYGNLWRWRNEGVEGQNGTLSLRYNKFNNRGGNKGNSKNKDIKLKCQPFQVLGSWMARVTMWQLGLGDAIFHSEVDLDGDIGSVCMDSDVANALSMECSDSI